MGGGGLEQFSVSPRPLGFGFLGFGAKGLGPGLDNFLDFSDDIGPGKKSREILSKTNSLHIFLFTCCVNMICLDLCSTDTTDSIHFIGRLSLPRKKYLKYELIFTSKN